MTKLEPRIGGSSVLRVARNVLKRTAGSETVLLDLDSEEFFGLDAVGARMFELLDEPQRLDDVIATLLTEYAVDRETLTSDVVDLVSELVKRNLLVVDA